MTALPSKNRFDASNAVRLCDRCEPENGITAGADAGDRACSVCGQHDAPHVYPGIAEYERLRGAAEGLLTMLEVFEDLTAPEVHVAVTELEAALNNEHKENHMTQYVGIVQQGMVLDQKVIVSGSEQGMIQRQADEAAKRLNDAQQGFGEGWTAVVLPVEQEDY
jgi:hypothetical protein